MIKKFLEYVVKSLVDNPDQVVVNEIENDSESVIELKVAPEDIGRVIGKQGKCIRALRLLAYSMALKRNKKVTVEVLG